MVHRVRCRDDDKAVGTFVIHDNPRRREVFYFWHAGSFASETVSLRCNFNYRNIYLELYLSNKIYYKVFVSRGHLRSAQPSRTHICENLASQAGLQSCNGLHFHWGGVSSFGPEVLQHWTGQWVSRCWLAESRPVEVRKEEEAHRVHKGT